MEVRYLDKEKEELSMKSTLENNHITLHRIPHSGKIKFHSGYVKIGKLYRSEEDEITAKWGHRLESNEYYSGKDFETALIAELEKRNYL